MFQTVRISLPLCGMMAFATCFSIPNAHATAGEVITHPLPSHTSVASSATRGIPIKTEQIVVKGSNRTSALTRPVGQTTYSSDRRDFANQVGQSVADMVVTIPGVSFTQGNGPRDTVVSVRGSGDRQSYGLKNLQVLEDGFPMTQPDGTARADLIDPHAYQGVDVFEGPASTLYGNYAINGAINFRTRKGADMLIFTEN